MTSKETASEALPKEIGRQEYDDKTYIYVKEAWAALPPGTDLSLGRFREWCKEQKYGMVSGVFGGRLMVRADTIPKVRPIE